MDTAATPQLEYATRPAWHQRRRWRVVAFVALLVAVAAAGFLSWRRWGSRLQARMGMLSTQRAVLTYEPPTDTVVFRQEAGLTFEQKPWARYLGTSKYITPQAWKTYHRKHVEPSSPLPSAGLQSHGTLFLHERRSPAGNRRLVTVDLIVSWSKDGTWVAADKRAIVPGSLRLEPKETWGGPVADDLTTTNLVGQRQDLMNVLYAKALTLFAGRADPADPARFTIDYEIDGRRETIDGRLLDDDSVELKLRVESPLTSRAK